MSLSLRLKANKASKDRCRTLVAVLENPKTLENIGSVIRNVDALGVHALYVVDGNNLLPKRWHEMRHRRSLMKISASAIKWTYVHRFQTSSECLDYLSKKKFVSVATSPHQKCSLNLWLDGARFTHKRLAVWFGNESHGISDEVAQNSAFCVSIPMHGIIESLNLGTCSGIVLYEVTRQRRLFRKTKQQTRTAVTDWNPDSEPIYGKY